MSNADDLITYSQRTSGGKAFRCSRRTAAHLDDTKAALKRQHPGATLVIIQGCYNTGVAASAGTHDYDACLDVYIPALGWWDAQRFLREQGWAAWYRFPPAFGRHIHMISLGFTTTVGKYVDGGQSLYGRKTTSSQVDDYYAHRTGLAGHAADPSWHPDNIRATVYHYTEKDWFDMADKKDLQDVVEAAVEPLVTAVADLRKQNISLYNEMGKLKGALGRVDHDASVEGDLTGADYQAKK